MPEILEGHEYVGSGNASSRSFLMDAYIAWKKKVLHVFDSYAEARHFSDVRNFFIASERNSVTVISDERTFWEFVAADSGEFVGTYTIFEKGRYSSYEAGKRILSVTHGQNLDERTFVEQLLSFGYSFGEHSENTGTYRREGDAVFVRWERSEYALSFFDGKVEEIREMGTFRTFEKLAIPDRTRTNPLPESASSFDTSLLAQMGESSIILHDPDFARYSMDLTSAFPKAIVFLGIRKNNREDLGVSEPEIDSEESLIELLSDSRNSFEFRTKREEPIRSWMKNISHVRAKILPPPKGFRLESFQIPNLSGGSDFFLADDILSPLFVRERTGTNMANRMDLLLKIAPGDTVVHRDYGIGIFHGCEKKTVGGNEREFVRIGYAGTDVLFVPLSEVYRISKYLGDDTPTLSKLGGAEWKKSVERAELDAEKVAHELLDIYAKRKIATRPTYRAFVNEEAVFLWAFPYEHTADQAQSIKEILSDMESEEPMDRLLSGDVGFGKTEVAMNAAYRAVLNGRQVAFVSPLVVLAYEHFESLSKRFEPFWVRIAVLTRFSKESEERAVLQWLRDGSIDIVVGTHRLLSTDVRFRQLGLLVVDEEHRFGVLDKEKIAAIRESIDILSLSATPIPRSLNFALSGVKKISILVTPPPRKKPIATSVSRWDRDIVRNAIELELARGGQIIVLHNRVKTLGKAEEELRNVWEGNPLRIATTHGQMSGTELEDRIVEFKEWKYDILLSTTVIENGVNFLSANTILIDEADEFGLASLHQLRGRVGRKDVQAYCHLLYRKELLADDAKKRLVAIASNAHLGAGFEISMRDLEIRGAGEILGVKQSGRSKETWLPLYFRLLEEKVSELKNGKKRLPDTKIDLDLSYGISDSFFDSEIDKLHFFRSLESVSTEIELENARKIFMERSSNLPKETENLFLLVRARIRLTAKKVASLKKMGKSYLFEFSTGASVSDFRKFLEMDTIGNFTFSGNGKIRASSEDFENDEAFLKFLVSA